MNILKISEKFTNKTVKIFLNRKYYSVLIIKLFKNVGIKNIIRTQYPFALPASHIPPTLSVELTNFCNLRCSYCTSPTSKRRKGFMTKETFSNLLTQIKKHKIRKVALVGNGEPLIHPNFFEFANELKRIVGYVSITTNLNNKNPETIRNVIRAKIDQVNISIDGHSAGEYESYRKGAVFSNLLTNLKILNEEKKTRLSSCLICIRLMLHPSNFAKMKECKKFWEKYCDVISWQSVINITGDANDVFPAKQSKEKAPPCTLPFKLLDVRQNGDIPLCSYSHMQMDNEDGLLLGNINKDDISMLWNGNVMTECRKFQKNGHFPAGYVCIGCIGTQ